MADSTPLQFKPLGEDATPPPGLKAPATETKTEGKKRGPGRPKGSGSNARKLETSIAEFVKYLAVPFYLVGDDHCAQVLENGAEPLGKAWADLARENPRVAKVLNALMEGSAWGGVITTTLGVAIPIAKHHVPALKSIPGPEQMVMSGMGAAMRSAGIEYEEPPDIPAPVTPDNDNRDVPKGNPGAAPAFGPAAVSIGDAGRMPNPAPISNGNRTRGAAPGPATPSIPGVR